MSQKYGSVVICKKEAELHLCIYKGFSFLVKSIAEGLNFQIMTFFLLNIQYPKTSPTIFHCLANLHGCQYQVNKTMSDLQASLN